MIGTFGFLKILDRYCYTQFWTLLAFGTALPAGLLLFTEEMQRMLVFVRDFGCPIDIFLSMTALQLPEIVVRCLPGGVLIGTVLCLYRMIEDREMVALLTAGVSKARIFQPFLVIAFVATLLSITINEFAAPSCLKSSIQLTVIAANNRDIPLCKGVKDFKGYKTDPQGKIEQIFLVASRKGGELSDTTLLDLKDKKNIQVTFAPKGFLKADSWTLYDGNVYNITEDKIASLQTSHFEKMQINPPDQSKFLLQNRDPFSGELNTLQLFKHIKSLEENGKKVSRQMRMDLARRFTDPLACFFIALACLPLVMLNKAKRNVISIAYAGIILVAYFSMRSVAGALCENGILIPTLAAALPCLIIATISGAFIALIKKL